MLKGDDSSVPGQCCVCQRVPNMLMLITMCVANMCICVCWMHTRRVKYCVVFMVMDVGLPNCDASVV